MPCANGFDVRLKKGPFIKQKFTSKYLFSEDAALQLLAPEVRLPSVRDLLRGAARDADRRRQH